MACKQFGMLLQSIDDLLGDPGHGRPFLIVRMDRVRNDVDNEEGMVRCIEIVLQMIGQTCAAAVIGEDYVEGIDERFSAKDSGFRAQVIEIYFHGGGILTEQIMDTSKPSSGFTPP